MQAFFETVPMPLVYVCVVAFILLSTELGFQLGRWYRSSEKDAEGVAAIGPMVGGLLGMLAFINLRRAESEKTLADFENALRRLVELEPPEFRPRDLTLGLSYVLAIRARRGEVLQVLQIVVELDRGQVGSAATSPLRQGIDLLSVSEGGADRALVLMSDGEMFDDKEAAFELAREAQAKDIHVVTVGFGTPGGAPIPLLESGGTEVKRDDDGQIVTYSHQRTSVPNVWAAGDITPGPQLAIVAAAEGAIAGLSIHKSLVPPERKLRPRTRARERRGGVNAARSRPRRKSRA